MKKEKRVLIFLGKPGSGKGTQAELVAKKLGIPSIAMGDMLRNIKKQKTPLAKKISGLIDKGQFVPDNLVFSILQGRIKKADCKKGYILDGFPRTLLQAKMFKEPVEKVIYIDVKNSAIVKRLSSRMECSCGRVYNLMTKPPKKKGICDACGRKLYRRDDDLPETIKKRLDIYEKQTKPLIEYYKNKKVLEKVNGEKEIKILFKDIIQILGK